MLNVRCYCKYPVSYGILEEMMVGRGLKIYHSTTYYWVQRYAPEINKRISKHTKKTSDSYRIDETYIKIKKIGHYLYRALNSKGQTIDFMLFKKRNSISSKIFFKKIFRVSHSFFTRVINIGKNKTYPASVNLL